MAEYLMAMTTVGNENDARKIAQSMVERRIVACVNVSGPVRSFYHWEGNLQDDSEYLLFMKTRVDLFPALETAINEIHPYDVPELIAVPIERGSAAYLGWMSEQIQLGFKNGRHDSH
jgi:periplasmic divalent cation tolerance protein